MRGAAALSPGPQGETRPSEMRGLEVDGLTTELHTDRGRFSAVRGVSFSLPPGETLVMLGESGSGKSVTVRSILRLLPGARITGSVRLGGRELTHLSRSELSALRGSEIAMVPQDPATALDPLRRVGSQITEVLRVHGAAASRAAARGRGEELLDLVGIPEPRRVMKRFPHELSGGMRQRVAIALAVSCEPSVLVADEPTSALDVTVQAQILELFQRLQSSLRMSVLLITHDVGVAKEMGGWVGVMYAGRLVEVGPTPEVLERPRHPYTRSLLAAVPTSGTERGTLQVIGGRPPLPGELLPGCAFAPRCPSRQARCLEAVPELVAYSSDAPQHRTACVVLQADTDQISTHDHSEGDE